MTLADKELQGYERDLTVVFQGDVYPVFVLMERLLRITDKDGNVIPFVLNSQQVRLYKKMCEQRRNKQPIRLNVLKARQIGFSTFIAGVFFIITMLTPNIRTAVVADIEDHAKNIFKKYEFFYNHLDDSNPNRAAIEEYARQNKGQLHPDSYKPKLKSNRGQQYLETLNGNSSLEVVVAGQSAGRSGTYQFLHLSECAFFPNLQDTLTSILQTVSRKNKNSMVFLETTANGFNEYKERWDKDYGRNSIYDAFFVSWFQNPDYSEKIVIPPILEEWEIDMKKKHKLTDEQMNWFHRQYQEIGESKHKMLQEYPAIPLDAFVTSGNSFFDREKMALRKEQLLQVKPIKRGHFIYEKSFSEDGETIILKNIKWEDHPFGCVRIYKEVEELHPYVGVCDPNNGGSDDNAIQMIDNFSVMQVATVQTNEHPHDEVAYQFYCLGMYYNQALLSNEMNLSKIIMEYLIKLDYPNLYMEQAQGVDDLREGVRLKYGHTTKINNRQFMIDTFKIAFRENPSMVVDYNTICQMETFQIVETLSNGVYKTKTLATGKNHDDLVMAFAAFFIVRNQQNATLFEKNAIIREKESNFPAYLEVGMRKNEEKNKKMNGLERRTGIKW